MLTEYRQPKPYAALSEWRLMRAYKKLHREVQRLVLQRCGILAEDLKKEMTAIVQELERRGVSFD